MQPRTPKYLADIREAAAFILEATRGRSEANYLEDRLCRYAVDLVMLSALKNPYFVRSPSEICSFTGMTSWMIPSYGPSFRNQLPKLRDEVDALLKEQARGT